MRFSTNVRSISYLGANPAQALDSLAEERAPVLITQKGEAVAVLQHVDSDERAQATMALLKLLALGRQDIDAARTQPVNDVVARLRRKHAVPSAQP